MKHNLKKIDETIEYLVEKSLDTRQQILADPVNIIMEADIELTDHQYDLAIEYIKRKQR